MKVVPSTDARDASFKDRSSEGKGIAVLPLPHASRLPPVSVARAAEEHRLARKAVSLKDLPPPPRQVCVEWGCQDQDANRV